MGIRKYKLLHTSFKAALALSMVLFSSYAYSDCSQGDLQGTWFFNGIAGNSYYQSMDGTTACKLQVASAGGVIGSSSSCFTRNGAGRFWINVTSGKLTVYPGCAVVGKFNYCNDSGACSSIVIDNAKMDEEKSVITLIGYAAFDSRNVFSLTGVKRD